MGGSETEDVAMGGCDVVGPHMTTGDASGSRGHPVVGSPLTQLDPLTPLPETLGFGPSMSTAPSVSTAPRNVCIKGICSNEVLFISPHFTIFSLNF